MKPANIKILHIDSNHPLLLAQLQQAGFVNDEDYTSDKQQIEAKIHNYHGIVIRSRFNIDKDFLDKATHLQFIARVGAGLESIDVDYAFEKNITLIAAPEGNRNAVGEHTLSMLLALLNKINVADAQIRSGHWNREANRGYELDGKTVGIIGYGNMGKSFARKLRGFDVKVLCYDVLENIGNADAKQVSLQELQQQSDVLSLHIPWTPETDQMVNANFIQAFAKPFWLINTSRGKNVVTADLAAALESGKILGAGLDVLEYEKSSFEHLFHGSTVPKAFSYLLQSDKVILSPHIAGWTFESHEKLAQVIVDKIKAKYSGEAEIAKSPKHIIGFGGLFFKSTNPTALKEWYGKNLGMDVNDWGCTFSRKSENGADCTTQWSPFGEDTTYFSPSEKPFMQNFRVRDLAGLMEKLKSQNVTMIGPPETNDYGKFAWILDPEGNKIELWEPIDNVS